jgi:hypothetical protein
MMTLVKASLFAVCAGTLYAALGCCAGVGAASIDNCAEKSGTANVTASGTFVDAANGVNATITGAQVQVSSSSVESESENSFVISGGTVTFSSPAGSTSEGLESSIEFTSKPSSGTTTQASTGATGGVSIAFETANGGDSYEAETGGEGTWSLDLSSVSQFCGGSDSLESISEFTVHGSLTATMVGSDTLDGGATDPGGTLTLNF